MTWVYHKHVVPSEPAVAVQEKQFLGSGVGRPSLILNLEKLMFLNSVGFIMKDIAFIGRHCLENWDKLEKLWADPQSTAFSLKL